MSTAPLDRLKAIVDLLGPNMWLQLDAVSFPWFFEISIDPEFDPQPAIEAGEAFAKQHGTAFVFDEKARVARFDRVYFKRDKHAKQTATKRRLNDTDKKRGAE